MKKVFLVLISVFSLLAVISCSSLSYKITPGKLDPAAVKYVTENGIADPNEYKGYQSLEKVLKLQKDVDITHESILLALKQAKEKENFDYARFKAIVKQYADAALATEDLLFNPQTGVISLGFSLLGMSATGVLGLMRKRPGDMTKNDFEQAVATIRQKSTADLTTKDKQFAQLVKGIQKFIVLQNGSNPEVVTELKATLHSEQDEDTRKAVAIVKTESK